MSNHANYVYLVVDRQPPEETERVVRVGRMSASGWEQRMADYRFWTLEGKFWKDGIQANGWQLSADIFAMPDRTDAGTIETNVRKALYESAGKQHLPRDYTDPLQGGRWEEFNTPPTGAGKAVSILNPISNLNMSSLLKNTSFEGMEATTVLDLNYRASKRPAEFAHLEDRSWIYILEARSLSGDMSILKVGQTRALDERLSSGTPTYLGMAKHEMSMAMHLFEVTPEFINKLPETLRKEVKAKNSDLAKRRAVEDALRDVLYSKNYQLQLDHALGAWRSRSNDLLKNDRPNTLASTLTPGKKGEWK